MTVFHEKARWVSLHYELRRRTHRRAKKNGNDTKRGALPQFRQSPIAVAWDGHGSRRTQHAPSG